MTDSERWFGRFAVRSTGIKMLLILTAALFPLGLIALFASIQSAHAKRLQRNADAVVLATSEARQVDVLLLRGSSILRTEIASGPLDAARCGSRLEKDAAGFPMPVRLALYFPDGALRCATAGFGASTMTPPKGEDSLRLDLPASRSGLRFMVTTADMGFGVGEIPTALLRQVVPDAPRQGIMLAHGSQRLRLTEAIDATALQQHFSVGVPFAGGRGKLLLTVVSNPISAVEVLLVLLPLLMWAAAAAIGWIVVDHLLVRPLVQLQRAVASYGPGGAPLQLPRLTTPSREISALGDAFAATTAQLARREIELEEGLNRQVRLTREVHHRVKNNLQVVASLINLHSRGTDGDVAAAYASIQRRVDALAVVHRNHYAELEENRGVALRSILAELTANLRATAPPAASKLTITLDTIPVFVTQDVAVPISFLVTEIVEVVMECDPGGRVCLTLTPGPAEDRAILTILAPGLVSDFCLARPKHDQFERILLGLSRQLRAKLDHDEERGRYSIALPVIPQRSGEGA